MLVVALVLATVVGWVLRARAGRVREARSGVAGWALAERTPAPDDRVLLLQLSSPVCTPCRQTRTVLDGFAARTPGLVHVEVDVAERVEVARTLDVMRTPTVVAFDRAGTEVLRVTGVPRLAELEAALAPALTRS